LFDLSDVIVEYLKSKRGIKITESQHKKFKGVIQRLMETFTAQEPDSLFFLLGRPEFYNNFIREIPIKSDDEDELSNLYDEEQERLRLKSRPTSSLSSALSSALSSSAAQTTSASAAQTTSASAAQTALLASASAAATGDEEDGDEEDDDEGVVQDSQARKKKI
jgi:hypothetical protein